VSITRRLVLTTCVVCRGLWQNTRHYAEQEVRSGVAALSTAADQMMANMRSKPSSLFAEQHPALKNPTCGMWCKIKLCGGRSTRRNSHAVRQRL